MHSHYHIFQVCIFIRSRLQVAFGYIKRPKKRPRKVPVIGQYYHQHGGDRFCLLSIIALVCWRAHVLTLCMVAFSKFSETPPDQDQFIHLALQESGHLAESRHFLFKANERNGHSFWDIFRLDFSKKKKKGRSVDEEVSLIVILSSGSPECARRYTRSFANRFPIRGFIRCLLFCSNSSFAASFVSSSSEAARGTQ